MTTYQTIPPGLHPSELSQVPISLNYIQYIAYFIVISSALTLLLSHDNIAKKVTFSFVLILILAIAQQNPQCARTSVFLLRLIIVEIVVLAIVYRLSRIIGHSKYLSQKIYYSYKDNQQKYSFAIIIFTLFVTNGIGFIYCISQSYHEELYYFPQLISMLIMVMLGFLVVGLTDYLYMTFVSNPKMSTRRKIFHFVPVGLLPFLVDIHYKLFTLMVFGAFYLFWLLQILRYFGKLAKREYYSKQKQYNIYNENTNNKNEKQQNKYIAKYKAAVSRSNVLTAKIQQKGRQIQSKLFSIRYGVEVINEWNVKITELGFIQWMEELNSARQKYFWFTHLSLILGLSITYIYYTSAIYPAFNQRQISLKRNISIILVIADAMAAIIGKKYGKPAHTIKYTNRKTIEGLIGFVMTAISLQIIICWLFNIEFDMNFLVLSGIICGWGELYSGDMDNIMTGILYIGFDYIYRQILGI